MELMDVKQAGQFLRLSPRAVHRLRDTGKMPVPLKLGGVVRWRKPELNAWIADAAPDVRKTGWQWEN